MFPDRYVPNPMLMPMLMLMERRVVSRAFDPAGEIPSEDLFS